MSKLEERRYWVVSPNVRYNEKTVPDWRQASVSGHAAFMGWGPDDKRHKLGHKFAYQIQPNNVILIARRHRSEPEIVGFGIVRGEFKKRLKGVQIPDEGFASLRKLRPFIPRSGTPEHVRLISALGHSSALAELHPDMNKAHTRVCKWMERQLAKKGSRAVGGSSTNRTLPRQQPDSRDPHIAAPPGNHQLDYDVRTKSQVIRAQKIEAKLLQRYRIWLKHQDRKLETAKYKKLQCYGFEEKPRNLIEAKSSTRREHIRMAVGQLSDYAFQGRKKFGDPNMAILVPEKPPEDIEEWLASLNIALIWREKGSFLDNANGKFT